MEIFSLLFLILAALACQGEVLQCGNTEMKKVYLLEGESFVFKILGIEEDLNGHTFEWHKNGTQPEPITTSANQSVHYCNKSLFFLEVKPEHAGVYMARHTDKDGRCSNHSVRIYVLKSETDPALQYGSIRSSDTNIRVWCPERIEFLCKDFKGNLSWKKNFTRVDGQDQNTFLIEKASEADQGVYTCVCTWMYNDRKYQSSGSRMVHVEEKCTSYDPSILSPEGSEVLADEGLVKKLKCTVFCGGNMPCNCEARWEVNGRSIQADGYSIETHKVGEKGSSKDATATAVLTIDKVSAKDFQTTFTCIGIGSLKEIQKNITLIQRKMPFGALVILLVGVLLSCLFVAVLLKYFTIDIVLLFRPCLSLTKHKNDTRIYDAYVIYQMEYLDNATEDRLSEFITKILPSVLEDKCRYRLFIHGRDDIPGEDHLEMVESCVQQSKRLMVILTPSSGSELTDQHPARPQYSDMGGFDWQIVLHHVLVQSEMGVILIQIGEVGPGGFTYLPPGLQHLILKNPPIRWGHDSRFWKKVRYLMPAVPAKKR